VSRWPGNTDPDRLAPMRPFVRLGLLAVFVATLAAACATTTPAVPADHAATPPIGPPVADPAVRRAVVATLSPSEAESGGSVGQPEEVFEFRGTVLPRSVTGRAQRATPPANLGAALGPHYPVRAREDGVEGEANVWVVLGPSGEVTSTHVTEEAPQDHGFGDACMAMLRAPGMTWQPARDEAGQAVESQFSFRCAFRLAD
jgi:TonB family protein